MEKCWGISKAGQNEAALMSHFYWGLLLLVTLLPRARQAFRRSPAKDPTMGKTRLASILAAIACSAAFPAAFAVPCVKESPPHSVALIELYTSEGCDSCPPAERWLSGIAPGGFGADQVIPLALHVDYWDRLGWKDRFSSARFSERQRALATLARSRTVYTPEVFLNLRELRGWGSATQFQQVIQDVNAKPALAQIRLELDPALSAQLQVKASFALKPGGAARQPQGFVALYENKLSTDVQAGENRGATLRHDFVVREWIGPIELVGGKAEYRSALALDPAWNPRNLGVAAFIQDFGSGEVLQATALPYCS